VRQTVQPIRATRGRSAGAAHRGTSPEEPRTRASHIVLPKEAAAGTTLADQGAGRWFARAV